MSGDEIKKLRNNLKLTQEDLAEMLGVTRLTISNYEKGGKIPEARLVMLNDILKGSSSSEKPTIILDDIIYQRMYNRLKPELDILDKDLKSLHGDFMKLFKTVIEIKNKIDEIQLVNAKNRKSST